MKKFYIKTFGCRLNQYQSEKLREHLSACNLFPASSPEEADMIIVNGCVVTHRGERDTRKYINKYSRAGKKVIATGCYINLPHITPSEHVRFLSYEEIKKTFIPTTVPDLSQTRHRILIGIQEGCNFRCTYCIVPFVRGKARDRNKDTILREIEQYVHNGAHEIVITGTEIGGYGRAQGTTLAKLIEEIKNRFPHIKIRLSSILPLYVTDEIINLFRNNTVLPHVHLPLQSGSPEVLKDMKRPYKLEKFIWAFEKLYEAHPYMAIGTDIIVGYPTETEEDFEMTYELIKRLPLAYIHVFLYSKRPFTQSALLKELPYYIIKNRETRLLKLSEHKRKSFIERFKGKLLFGMIEKVKSDVVTGTTENYIKFSAEKTARVLPGHYVKLKILNTTGFTAISSIEESL